MSGHWHHSDVFRFLLMFLACVVALPLPVVAQDSNQQFPRQITVTVTNPMEEKRENVFVRIPATAIRKAAKDFNVNAFAVFAGNLEIPSQYNEPPVLNDGIVLILDKIDATEMVTLTVRYSVKGEYRGNYPKRTQAELSHKTEGNFVNREYIGGTFRNVKFLRVPKEHKDHSWFIRYEGPGWESEKVGYRFYLDQRNATDAFGKKTTDMVLQDVGQDGFDSYHEMQLWGMDVMKVGKSLGVGSIGYNSNGKVTRVEKTDSVTCEIKRNGEIYSEIETRYYGWEAGEKKTDLYSTISIHGGARHTLQQLRVYGGIDRICTGVVKDPHARLQVSKGNGDSFAFLATYGKQSLNNDNLGFAVFFPPSSLVEFTEDNESHVADLRVERDQVAYYFLAAWSGEPGGIGTAEAFDSYVRRLAKELANPVKVSVSK